MYYCYIYPELFSHYIPLSHYISVLSQRMFDVPNRHHGSQAVELPVSPLPPAAAAKLFLRRAKRQFQEMAGKSTVYNKVNLMPLTIPDLTRKMGLV